MPIYSVQGPDGRIYDVEGPAGASEAQIIDVVRRQMSAPTKEGDRSGFTPALKSGFKNLQGDLASLAGKTGLMDIDAAEAYRNQKQAEAKQAFQPTEKGWTEAPGTKIAELLGGSLPYVAAPAAAGAASLFGAPALAATGLAGLASAAQFTGSNLGRQMEEGKSLKETELGSAALAAVPQAALDMVGLRMIPGVRQLFASAGKEITADAAKAIAEQGMKSVLKDYGTAAVKTMGAEGLTEAGQQVFERLQAGLNLTDEKARSEYFDNFIGGAVLGGVLSPAGRFVERGSEQSKARNVLNAEATKERVAKAKETEAATAAEEAKKQTPDYAKEVGQQYDTLFEQFKTQKAALKTPGKDASPVEKAEYKDAQVAVKDLNDQLKKLVPEYRRTEKLRTETVEQDRLAGMSPEDFMLEQMGQQTDGMQASGRKRRGAMYDVEAPVTPPVDTSLQDYAAGQLEAASNAGALGIEDRVAYLMQDPAMADQLVKTRTKMPGMSSNENNAVLGALKLQLKAQEKTAAEQAKEAAAQTERVRSQLGGAAPGSELMGAARQSPAVQATEQTRLEDEARVRKVTPEIEALQRIASKPAGGMDQYALEGMAQPPTPGVTPPENITPSRTASTVKSTVEKLIAERDVAEQERAAAAKAGEPAAAKAAANRAEEAQNMLSRIASEGEESVSSVLQNPLAAWGRPENAKNTLAKVSREDASYATAFVNARKDQDTALFELEDAVDKLRRGAVLGGKATEEGTTTAPLLQKRANDLKKQYIAAALQEAALHRRAMGQPAVSTDEATSAAAQMDAALEELIVRMQAAPRRESLQEVITKPAQVRGTEIVSPAETKMRDMRPLEERRFGAPQEAVKVIQDQLAELREKLSNPDIKPTKVETPLRVQSQKVEAAKTAEARGENATTLGGELRRRTEYVRDKMSRLTEPTLSARELATLPPAEKERRAKTGMRPMARDVLNKAADLMDSSRATRDLLDAVESVVDRMNSGQQITQTDLRAVNDAVLAISKQAQEGEVVGRIQGQGELFTERQDRARDDANLGVIRQNFANFEKSPPVLKARAALAQAKQALKEAKARAEKVAAQNVQKKQERRTDLGNAIKTQRSELQRAVDDAVAAEKLALEQLAQVPIINAQKAVEAAKKDLDALQEKINAAPDFTEKLKYATDLVKQREAIDTAQTDLDKNMAESRAVYDTATLVAAAHRDSLVQFEFKALEKLEKQKDKERKKEEFAATQTAAGIQRARLAKTENDARLANEKADKERRAMEQRLLSGLGKEGIKRVAGEVAAIQSDTDKAVAAGRAAAEKNREQGDEALTSTFDLPQTARGTSPVTRDVTRPGRLEESRKPKQTNVAIKSAEMEEANAIAAEENPAKKLTPRQEQKAAQLQKQELLESKERLEAGLRAQLADLETRISALNNGIKKPAVELMTRLEAQKETIKGLIKAARRGVELAGKEAAAVERELNKPVTRGTGKGLLDDGVAYRTVTTKGATTLSTQQVENLAKRVTEGWVNAPEIEVVQDETQLPVRIRNQMSSDEKTGKVPGLYDTKTKKVYLIVDNLATANDVVLTIAHEAAGHHGLRELLGDTYTSTMDNIFDGNKAVREQAKAKMETEPNLSQQMAVEEVLAEMAEKPNPTPAEKNALQRIYAALKQWLAKTFKLPNVTDAEVQQLVANARQYVIEGTERAAGEAPEVHALYRTKEPKYANDGLAGAGAVADKLIAKQRTLMDTVKTEGLGLGLATRLIDRFAPLERISKLMDSLKGTQMMYYARMYDQRMHFVAQSVGNGAVQLVEKTRADNRKEWIIESKEGASLKGVVDILKTAEAGSPEANSRLFSLYLAAKRAERVGLNKLNFGGNVTQADLDSAMAAIKAIPGLAETFADAQREYNQYNKGLVQFAVDTGALSKEAAAEMTKANDYVPYYRTNNGSVEMLLGKETITRVGSLKEQPYLKELVGGDEQILDFMTSSVQNTNMLTDMALRNLATKNAVFELQGLGMATVGKGSGASGPDVVKFKVDGQERFAIVDTQEAGFPGELLVKGLEGIPTQTTWLTKAMGGPARVLRKAVVLNPLYAARQIFRDSLAAPLLSGADFAPVMGALRQIGKPAGKTLEQRGITGGQVFTGTQEDLTKILRDMSENKAGWAQGLARLEAMSMEADALTRRAQYDSYIKQGLSEMEATFMALESMNFSKRGASPAMHTLSTIIPFFNAQVQSLNVLYKAMSGNMPFNEKLKIREKLLARGMIVAGMSMLYAALMQDDETYKNATPDQKYGNWFIHLPGVEEAVRIPIPFEVGYIFKALPEAIVNTMMDKHGGEDAAKAFKQIALQLIPGGTSWGIPQALKPALEVALGKSTFTGRDLESAHEQSLLPGQRVREKTTALAAQIGGAFNVSPIKIDALIQGYTSTMGLAFVQALSFAIPTPPTAEKATGRLSEMPVVNGLFQPKDAGGVINAAYERMKEAEQVKNTFNDLVQKGKAAEAKEFLQNNLEQFALSGLATNFTTVMQKLSEAERAVKASNADPEKKREQLDALRQQKIKMAQMARSAAS